MAYLKRLRKTVAVWEHVGALIGIAGFNYDKRNERIRIDESHIAASVAPSIELIIQDGKRIYLQVIDCKSPCKVEDILEGIGRKTQPIWHFGRSLVTYKSVMLSCIERELYMPRIRQSWRYSCGVSSPLINNGTFRMYQAQS